MAAVFDYTPTRERAGTERFLKDYGGFLQADAYVAYDSFFTDPARGLVEVACWAHTRRHFHQALDTDRARMEKLRRWRTRAAQDIARGPQWRRKAQRPMLRTIESRR